MKRSLALVFALGLQAAQAAAPLPVPDAGLRAEMQGEWRQAVDIYTKALAAEPGRGDLWERIADIRAVRLKDPAGAVAALREAVKQAPNDARLYAKLSRAYAVVQDGPDALAAINRAVALEQNNAEYLSAQGQLATWNSDYAAALASYDNILARTPDDADALLGAARAAAQLGKLDIAVAHYRRYLGLRPEDKVAMMEYMETEASAGNTKAIQEYDALYRQRFGESKEYWLGMADIYALDGDDLASASALAQASRLAPNDAELLFRLAQTYPTLKQADAAKAAIERAVELDPKNTEYLRTRAELASERSDYAMALDSYGRILAIAPDDAGALLGIARVRYWQGKDSAAEKAYRIYLAKHPDVAAAAMEYIVVVTEEGDYARAMELLEAYRQRFGENIDYRKQKARILAWADRPTPALALVAGLAPELPDDYPLAYTRTVALHYANRPRDALASLAEAVRLQPDDKETDSLKRFIMTPLRSSITLDYGYEAGSDDVSIRHTGVTGEYVITPETRLFGGADRQAITAAAGSGYEKPDGGTRSNYDRQWLGIKHRFTPKLSADVQAGNGYAEGASRLVYEIGADLKPSDLLSMRLSRRQDLYAVSPLAASRGIEQRINTLDATWTPNLRYTVDGLVSYADYSDGNSRWEALLAPRRAFVRNSLLDLDLGVSARWYGFDHDPSNGYYAPTSYESYAFTVFTYWKINDDNGIGATFSVGPYKDNTMPGYRTGGDVALEGMFGIYRDWYLDVKGGLSSYRSGGTPGYRSHMFEVSLTRRF